MNVACVTSLHRHQQKCAKCGVVGYDVYGALRPDGSRWLPLCTTCNVKVVRIRAVARAVAS